MAPRDRTPWRVAHLVRRQLRRLQHAEQRMVVDQYRTASDLLTRLATLSRRLDKALARSWHGAVARLSRQLHRAREDATAELAALERVSARSQATVPSMRELDEELFQLEEELDGWRYDRRENALCATTGPIELEGVHLGRFEIRLRLDELSSIPHHRAYEVVALEPSPAAGSPQVTHPHVADEKLCEGEASSAIRHALASGRLGDFFMLVRSVLETYNPSSPYVELANWHGEPCGECGERVDEERSTTCQRCETVVCEACTEPCADCRDAHCPACLVRCERCEDLFCPGCIERCEACGIRCCSQCLDDELCRDCHQLQQEEADDHDQPPEAPPPEAQQHQQHQQHQHHQQQRPVGPSTTPSPPAHAPIGD